MTTTKFHKGQQINAGNFIVSIGAFDTSDVAIISKHSGDFVKIRQAKVSKVLRKVKRNFPTNSNDTFTFQHFSFDRTQDLIDTLKGK